MTNDDRLTDGLREGLFDHMVDSALVTEIFHNAPPVDWTQLRNDLDRAIDQDIVPRG